MGKLRRLWVWTSVWAAMCAAAPVSAESLFVVAPVRRAVRAVGPAEAVEHSLEAQIAELGLVVGPAATRDALRRYRIREVSAASPESLARLLEDLEADWLVDTTVHDVLYVPVPDMSISIRLYDRDGTLEWVDFEARSAIDGEKLLGFGVVDSVEELAPEIIARLVERMPTSEGRKPTAARSSPGVGRPLGRLALVPLTGYVERDALAAADTATEAARAVITRANIPLASPECVRGALRRQSARAYGELDSETRQAIRESCGTDRILTGALEHWAVSGGGTQPRPEAAVSLRLLDSETGRILWLDSAEATGWDRGGLFGLGRTYSRGALLEDVLSRLTRELLRAKPATSGR